MVQTRISLASLMSPLIVLSIIVYVSSFTHSSCSTLLCKKTFSCHSSLEPASDAIKADVPFSVKLADGLISTVFSVKPLFKLASSKARSGMISRGLKIDVDWVKEKMLYEENFGVLKNEYDRIAKPSISYPSYYEKPFHAYESGNLCWEAAMEVEPAALTVHAPIFTKDRKELERDGDNKLRDNFHRNMKSILAANNFVPKRILDIGCSTGLSTLKLVESFPGIEVIGVDLSPFMLAVATFQLNTRLELASARKYVTYMHAAGEDSTLGKGDVNLATMCLVSHELPAKAARAIFQEAYDTLPAGGAFAIMDMDPKSPFFQKFASNPFAFAAFKSTEPWIQEYISMDLEGTLFECGFENVIVQSNSPRHRTVVAFKR